MTILSRIALLSLAVSALPFAALAQEDTGTPWIYGVAERHDAEADDGNVWYSGLEDEDGLLAARAREPKPPKPAKPPKTPPAPVVPPPPPPAPPPVGNNTGAGILVAIVDTGIDLDHPEFAGRIAAGGACFGGSAACPGL
ncbi:MAG: hypothetical protein JNL06_18380, partial [Alphaproteobacteria bacterium]|nr:hypothetical protein [Alphaproteobacteria bacterium]